MRIVVNDIAASEGGALSVLCDFYNSICESNDENEWIFLLSDYYFKEKKNIKIKIFKDVKNSWMKRLNFELFNGQKIINKLNPDVYFSFQNTATIGVKAEQIVYLHQSIPYQNEKNFSFLKKDERKLAIYQKVMGKLYNYLFRKTDSKIIVQSRWIKKEIGKHVNNEVLIVPPSIKITEQCLKKAKTENTITFFYPASDAVYKNHDVIYSAVDHIIQKGYNDFKVILTIPKKNVKNQGIFEFVGYISRDEVFQYYTKSILLFPSYIETYGLPLKEATFFHTPIIASKTDFSNEVLENYGNVDFFNKDDSIELANIMISYLVTSKKMVNKNINRSLVGIDTSPNNLLRIITK